MSEIDATLDQWDLESSRERSLTRGPEGYEMLERVGQGAFGEVWKACQVRTGQLVALKLLRQERRWDISQLRQELDKLRQVSQHPAIVTLLDADLEGSPAFLAMPFLVGGSLQSQRPDCHQVRRWLEAVAQALAYSHQHGIFHCDLKPANLLLDDQSRPLLADFGQSLGQEEQRSSWGTLGYMPPEQALPGSRAQASWDIYALGATFYMLLSGHYPRCQARQLEALSQTGGDLSERLSGYVQLIQSGQLVPLRELNPEVDEDLELIVLRCLSLDLRVRTQSAQQIVEDLARSRQGLPLWSNRPWKRSYVARRWWLRHWRTALPTSLVLGGLATAWLWGVTVPYRVPDPQRQPAPLARADKPPVTTESSRVADLYQQLAELKLVLPSSPEQPLWDAALWPDGRLDLESPALAQLFAQSQPAQQLLLRAAAMGTGSLAAEQNFSKKPDPLLSAVCLLEARRQKQTRPLPGWRLAWAVLVCGGRFLARPDAWNREDWLNPWVLTPLRFLNQVPLEGLPEKDLRQALDQAEDLRLGWPTPEQALLWEQDMVLQRLREGTAWKDLRLTLARGSGDFTFYSRAITSNLQALYNSQLYWLQVRDFQAMQKERESWFHCDSELRPDRLGWLVAWLHPVSLSSVRLMRFYSTGGDSIAFYQALLEAHCLLVRMRLRMAGELARRQGRVVHHWSDLPLQEIPDDPVKPVDKLHLFEGAVTGFDPGQPLTGKGSPHTPLRRLWLRFSP